MEIMEQKDSMIQIQSQNHSKLIDQLRNIISRLDMPHQYKMALLDSDLATPKGILDCTEATMCLQEKMEAELHTGINASLCLCSAINLLKGSELCNNNMCLYRALIHQSPNNIILSAVI